MDLSLHHVALSVPDLEPVLAFYEQGLGLRRLPRPPMSSKGVWLDLGETQLHLIEWPQRDGDGGPAEPAHGRLSHLALRVRDYAAALAHVRGLGVAVTEGAAGLKQFFFYDPAGHVVELIEG